jgi:hypothetical protein
MRKMRAPVLSPLMLFLVTMLLGVTIATLLFRQADRSTLAPPGLNVHPYTGAVTDAQKLYIESRNATSELLFKAAFTTFGALVAFVVSGARGAVSAERGIFAGAGLLLSSMYAAFLYQIGVSRCMEASLNDMFGPILNVPILCQFWFLFVAVMLVAVALFQGSRRPAMTAAILALLVGRAAHAEPTPLRCVHEWAQSRSVELPAPAERDAVALVDRLAAREELTVTEKDRCTVTATMLDAVRFSTLHEGSRPQEPRAEPRSPGCCAPLGKQRNLRTSDRAS